MTAVFGLFGAGGFGREVMPAADLRSAPFAGADRYYVDDRLAGSTFGGVPVISEAAFFALDCETRLFNVAVASAQLRRDVADRCVERGAVPASIKAANTTIYDDNEIGEGLILCAYAMVTSGTRIGRFFHANLYSYVAHDCVIGDFVTFAPKVQCNGNVHVGDGAYIGTGAIIRDGRRDKPTVIGAGAIVGMGAVVTKDVAPGATVVGNPARALS